MRSAAGSTRHPLQLKPRPASHLVLAPAQIRGGLRIPTKPNGWSDEGERLIQ
jgi:hypothetical protein